MSVEIKNNRVELDVSISPKIQKEVDDLLEKLRKAKQEQTILESKARPGRSILSPGEIIEEGTVEEFGQQQQLELKKQIDKYMRDEGMNPDVDIPMLVSIARSPLAGILSLGVKGLPLLAGLFTAEEIATFLFNELTARGRPFDLHFKRIIADENNVLRERELNARIRSGFAQLIITSAGQLHPRQVFNTYEEVRKGQMQELDQFRIRKVLR